MCYAKPPHHLWLLDYIGLGHLVGHAGLPNCVSWMIICSNGSFLQFFSSKMATPFEFQLQESPHELRDWNQHINIYKSTEVGMASTWFDKSLPVKRPAFPLGNAWNGKANLNHTLADHSHFDSHVPNIWCLRRRESYQAMECQDLRGISLSCGLHGNHQKSRNPQPNDLLTRPQFQFHHYRGNSWVSGWS